MPHRDSCLKPRSGFWRTRALPVYCRIVDVAWTHWPADSSRSNSIRGFIMVEGGREKVVQLRWRNESLGASPVYRSHLAQKK